MTEPMQTHLITTWAALIVGGVLSGCATMSEAPKSKAKIEIPVVSDIPYTDAQAYNFRKSTEAIRDGDYPFVVHLGDYKSGDTPCGDAARAQHAAWMAGFGGTPVYYTPGDNDWTDCDRDGTGTPIPELAELDALRATVFTVPQSGETRFSTERQDDYPENAIWSHGGIVFATLHIVATNNGRAEILLDDKTVALARVAQRDAANLAWLKRAFARAIAEKANAVVVFQQADPDAEDAIAPCEFMQSDDCNGLIASTEALKASAAQFGGPALLVHGDTGPYCMDTAFGGDQAPNLWRFNGSGDYLLIDAAKLIIEPSNRNAPFRAESVLHRVPPASGCGSTGAAT